MYRRMTTNRYKLKENQKNINLNLYFQTPLYLN